MADRSAYDDVQAAFRLLANDMTGKYNTLLSPEEEAAYQQQYPNPRDTYDYDMRGAFKQGIMPAENGHYPDTFKKPNHPTFSDQSMYHGMDGNFGGSWMQQGDQWTFAPGKTNIDTHTLPGLQSYMQQNDPSVTLIAPPMQTLKAQ